MINQKDISNFKKRNITRRSQHAGQAMGEVSREKILNFIDRVRRYGRTEKGTEIILRNWSIELLRLIGDFRIHETLTTGIAQNFKAQPLDAKVLTPNGFIEMGKVSKGQQIITVDGSIAKVTGVYPQGVKEVFRVEFGDGGKTECCGDHLWLTQTRSDRNIDRSGNVYRSGNFVYKAEPDGTRPGTVKTLNEIRRTQWHKAKQKGILRKFPNHTINTLKGLPVQPSYGLPIDFYLHGRETARKARADKNAPPIQPIYFVITPEERLDLLRGIFDVTAFNQLTGKIAVESKSVEFLKSVRELVWSCGGTNRGIRQDKKLQDKGVVHWEMLASFPDNGFNPFREKADGFRGVRERVVKRQITEIESVGEKECQCISIDHPSQLYVTDDYILTHNTLSHNLLHIDCVTQGLSSAWIYDELKTLQRQVSLQFLPMIEIWGDEMGVQATGSESKNKTLYQVGKGNAIFSHANSKNKSGTGTAAGSALVAFTADIAFMEEKSQWEAGADSAVYDRLAASTIPSQPVRQLGTNGRKGTGIDVGVSKAEYNFQPHCYCPSCEKEINLHPFGTLLLPEERTKPSGETFISYLDSAGRPNKWHHHDEDDPIKTAYFGCPKCKAEIPNEIRWEESYYRCINTGVKLADYLERDIDVNNRQVAAIHIFPALKETNYNRAAQIIQRGLSDSDPYNWQEQMLGVESQGEVVKISRDMIRRALKAPPPPYEKPGLSKWDRGSHEVVKIAGVDCGRSSGHWLAIITYYIPWDRYDISSNEISTQAYRSIDFIGNVMKTDLPEYLTNYNVDYGFIDNEPEISEAARICDITPLKMADQKDKQYDDIAEGKSSDGAVDYPVFKIRNQKFLRQVMSIFSSDAPDGFPLVRMSDPGSWEKWFNLDSSDLSPVRHLCSMEYNPEKGKIERPSDHVDDLYHAIAFAEAAFFQYLVDGVNQDMWG